MICFKAKEVSDFLKISQRFPKEIPEIAQRTFDEILKNPKATLSELSEKLEISDRTVKNHIALLKEANVIERVGGKTYGYWKVLLSDGEK